MEKETKKTEVAVEVLDKDGEVSERSNRRKLESTFGTGI